MCFRWLWNMFYRICFFKNHFGGFLRQLQIPLPRYGHKCLFASFETDFTAFAVLFSPLSRVFASIGFIVDKIQSKTCLCRLWNWFYCIWRSFFKNLEVFSSIISTLAEILAKTNFPASKPFLRHSLCYLLHIGGYFSSIGGTVAKIMLKPCVR